MPRLDAGAVARRAYRAAGGAPPTPESALRTGATAAGDGDGGHHAAAGTLARVGAAHVRAGAPNARGGTLQQPDGAAFLSWLRAAGRRAPEVHGVRRVPADRAVRVELGAAAPGAPGSVPRLVARGAESEHWRHRLQHPVFDLAVGRGRAPGLASARAPDAAALDRGATRLWASGVFCRDLHRPHPLSRHVLPGGELAVSGSNAGSRQG